MTEHLEIPAGTFLDKENQARRCPCVLLLDTSGSMSQDPQGGAGRPIDLVNTSIVDGGSCLLALSSSADLTVFKPEGKQYEEIAKVKVSDTPIYAHPVLAGNRIFIKDQETVTMLAVQ